MAATSHHRSLCSLLLSSTILSPQIIICRRWLLFGFLIPAIILSWLAVSSCHFMHITDSTQSAASTSVGLFRFLDDTTETCVGYPDDMTFDELAVKARKAGAIAPAAGTLALLLLWFEFCLARIPCGRILVGASLMTAQISQCMSLLVFGSQTHWCVHVC